MTTSAVTSSTPHVVPAEHEGDRTDPRTGVMGVVSGAVAGVLGAVSFVGAIAGEVIRGEDFMASTTAELVGWCAFIGACLLVLSVATLSFVATNRRMRAAWGGLVLGSAGTVGGAATLALVVPMLAERAPELVNNPPAAVPATFILSGVLVGVSTIVLALGLRRTLPGAPRWVFALLFAGAVVSILPLPSRYFLVAFAVAGVLQHLRRRD